MFKKLFLDHPRDVEETYFQHMMVAFRFAGTMFTLSIVSLIHGIVPGLFTKTASSKIINLHNRMMKR